MSGHKMSYKIQVVHLGEGTRFSGPTILGAVLILWEELTSLSLRSVPFSHGMK